MKKIKGIISLIVVAVLIMCLCCINVSAAEKNLCDTFNEQWSTIASFRGLWGGEETVNGIVPACLAYQVFDDLGASPYPLPESDKKTVTFAEVVSGAEKYVDLSQNKSKFEEEIKKNGCYDSATNSFNVRKEISDPYNILARGGQGPTYILGYIKNANNEYTVYSANVDPDCFCGIGYDSQKKDFIIPADWVINKDYRMSGLTDFVKSFEESFPESKGNIKNEVPIIIDSVYYYESVVKYDGQFVKIKSSKVVENYFTPTADMILPRTSFTEIDKNSGITSIDTSAFQGGVTVSAKKVSDSKIIKNAEKSLSGKANENKIIVYDFSAEKNGKSVQPKGKVKVQITVPSGYDANKIGMYYISDDYKTVKKISVSVDKTKKIITGELEHFSMYALVEQEGSPNTGDNLNISGFMIIALISLISTVFVIRKAIN